jgi:transketolase
MRALPNINIYSPADPFEAEIAIKSAIQSKNTSYIRLSKNSSEIHKNFIKENPQEIIELFEGFDLQIISTGEILKEAVKAREELSLLGYNIGIISVIKLKPINKILLKHFIKSKFILSLEEHNLDGGFGSIILEEISDWEYQPKVYRMGINNKFSKIVGNSQFLLNDNQISSNHIAIKCIEIITKGI